MLSHACKMSLEGIISKRADAPYRSGRCDTFIKAKCSNAQEFVVGGYIALDRPAARDRRAGRSAITTTASSSTPAASAPATRRAVARDLWKRLHPLETDKPAFDEIPRGGARRANAIWVEPKMVIETQSPAAGPPTATSATRRSRACARTSRRRKSCGRCRPKCKERNLTAEREQGDEDRCQVQEGRRQEVAVAGPRRDR